MNRPMLIAVFVAICLFAAMFMLAGPVDLISGPGAGRAASLAQYGCMMGLVAVVWSICFRSQLERFQIRLIPLFMLVAMECVLLWAIRFFRGGL
jgi:hypothetical protein